MELRRYWQIIRRYWLVIGLLTLIGVVAAVQYYTANPPSYQATAIVNVSQLPTPGDIYSGLYANQASDYATDELVKIIPGNVFMTAVSTQLKEGNINFPPDALKGMVNLEPKNRTITITVNNSDRNAALKIAQTVANTLQNSAAEYLQPRQVQVRVIDLPEQSNLSGGRTVLLAMVRILAGLLAGVALAFLLAYLDNTIRSKAELEEILGLPVMGYIPVASKLEASHAIQAVQTAEDPLINNRLSAIQRPATPPVPLAPPIQPATAPPIVAELPTVRPETFKAETGTIVTEETGSVPVKTRRTTRPRKDQAGAGSKEELPRL
jgi:capsular polysaccharide biosynthesis protein